jgi:hypothetical protein
MRIVPEWLSLLSGKKIQYTGSDMPQRGILNFTGDVAVTDDILGDRTNVDMQLGVTTAQVIAGVGPLIVSQTFGTDVFNPGTPLTGIRLYSSGGYAHVNDAHGGHSTVVGVPRMTLSDHNQTVSVATANDFWLYSGTLTGNRAYYLTSSNATVMSAVTFELLDPGPFAVDIVNLCAFSASLFTKQPGQPVVVDCVFDGNNFQLVGWKYRTH